MAKYRKKPIIVEAEQWFPEKEHFVYLGYGKDRLGVYRLYDQFVIDTLEGLHHVSPGDYIITGIKGEKYPCKPDIFEQTYELVEE